MCWIGIGNFLLRQFVFLKEEHVSLVYRRFPMLTFKNYEDIRAIFTSKHRWFALPQHFLQDILHLVHGTRHMRSPSSSWLVAHAIKMVFAFLEGLWAVSLLKSRCNHKTKRLFHFGALIEVILIMVGITMLMIRPPWQMIATVRIVVTIPVLWMGWGVFVLVAQAVQQVLRPKMEIKFQAIFIALITWNSILQGTVLLLFLLLNEFRWNGFLLIIQSIIMFPAGVTAAINMYSLLTSYERSQTQMSEFPVALSLEPRKYSIGKMAKMNDSRNSSRRDSELLDLDANVTVTMNTPQPKMESPRHMAQNGDQKYRNWTKSTKNSSGSLVRSRSDATCTVSVAGDHAPL